MTPSTQLRALAAKWRRRAEVLFTAASDNIEECAAELESLADSLEGEAPLSGEGGTVEAWQHIANEWADAATNGVQWLRNVRDGISQPEEGIAEMLQNFHRIRELTTRTTSGAASDSVEARTAESVGTGALNPIAPMPTDAQKLQAVMHALADAEKAIAVLSTILRNRELQGYMVADEILGNVKDAKVICKSILEPPK